MKKAIQITLALVVVLALAGLSAYAWKAQGRTKENAKAVILREHSAQADLAKSLLPMLERVGVLKAELPGLKEGTPQRAAAAQELMELENIIGDAEPILVFTRDPGGNTTLVMTDMARKELKAQIQTYRDDLKKL